MGPAPRAAKRRLPWAEMVTAALLTAASTAASLTLHLGNAIPLPQHSPRGWDLGDLVPPLLVLSVCLVVMGVRRWGETERERIGLELTSRRLARSETQYRSLIEVSPSPVMVYDESRTILFVNAAMLSLLRASDRRQIVGRNTEDFIAPGSETRSQAVRERLDADGMTSFMDLELRRRDGTLVEVQVAVASSVFDGHEGFQAVYQDVSQLRGIADNLRRTTEETIQAMARIAETRDPYTSGHQERVAGMAVRMARRLGLDESVCESIRLAGIVHDIGKLSIPVEILTKPGRLTTAEFELIKLHVERGYELLAPIHFPWPIAEIIRQHHERLDGSGYPRGLRGDEICIEARVLSVADTIEAISSHRPYRPALGLEYAIEVVREGRGTLYDDRCVDIALELAAEGALLSDGADRDAGVRWATGPGDDVASVESFEREVAALDAVLQER